MTATSQLRGHTIEWDGKNWSYCDTDELTINNERPCGHCGKENTSKGHDACIADLPNVINACCGHGDINEAYVMFKDKNSIRGNEAIKYFKLWQIIE